MTAKGISTEENILNVAREVFMRNGYSGTTMQQIADEAGINKSLLHYYYRSKEKLFGQIFAEVFSQFIPELGKIFMTDKSLEEKIRAFVDSYIEGFIRNPLIPIFVMQELSTNPQHLADLIRKSGIDPEMVIKMISESLKKEDLNIQDPRQFMVNMIGLCVFPFAAQPLIQRLIFNNDEKAYSKFLLERKHEVSEFLLNAIRKG
ncbi:MAG: TetR/AcrR family transcriptional regulator [Bacteroidales bacterium]|nr:TetR/AcrR family transcriptional regulator [Bacteroidales bacterium]